LIAPIISGTPHDDEIRTSPRGGTIGPRKNLVRLAICVAVFAAGAKIPFLSSGGVTDREYAHGTPATDIEGYRAISLTKC
jgi:hypothetical protein